MSFLLAIRFGALQCACSFQVHPLIIALSCLFTQKTSTPAKLCSQSPGKGSTTWLHSNLSQHKTGSASTQPRAERGKTLLFSSALSLYKLTKLFHF